MHDLILWLASRLTETPQTIEQLDKAYQAIEAGDDIACLNALTKSIDKVEKTAPLPYKYQQTVEKICDKAIKILESKTQSGGADPIIPALAGMSAAQIGIPMAIGATSVIALQLVVGVIVWAIRWRRRRQAGKSNALPPTSASEIPLGSQFVSSYGNIPPTRIHEYGTAPSAPEYGLLPLKAPEYGRVPRGQSPPWGGRSDIDPNKFQPHLLGRRINEPLPQESIESGVVSGAYFQTPQTPDPIIRW